MNEFTYQNVEIRNHETEEVIGIIKAEDIQAAVELELLLNLENVATMEQDDFLFSIYKHLATELLAGCADYDDSEV